MDAHSEPAVEATDPTADIPVDDTSVVDSIDNSLANAFRELDLANAVEEPTEEPAAEPAEESAAEPAEESAEENTEPIEELSDDLGDDWTPKAAKRFQQLKSELKTVKSEAEQLRQTKQEFESKIKELQGITESKNTEELAAKLQEYERRQMLVDLESTDAYQKSIGEPISALMDQAAEIAERYEVDPYMLIDVIGLEDEKAQEEQLEELLASASTKDKSKVYSIIEKVNPILERRQQMFENAEQALAEAKQVEEARERQEAADRAKLRETVTHNVVERIKQKLPFLSGLEGLDLDSVQKSASEVDPTAIHPVDHAYNAVSAKLVPVLVRERASLAREVELLTERLAEYEDAEPKMSGANRTDSSSGERSGDGFEQRVNSALASMLG